MSWRQAPTPDEDKLVYVYGYAAAVLIGLLLFALGVLGIAGTLMALARDLPPQFMASVAGILFCAFFASLGYYLLFNGKVVLNRHDNSLRRTQRWFLFGRSESHDLTPFEAVTWSYEKKRVKNKNAVRQIYQCSVRLEGAEGKSAEVAQTSSLLTAQEMVWEIGRFLGFTVKDWAQEEIEQGKYPDAEKYTGEDLFRQRDSESSRRRIYCQPSPTLVRITGLLFLSAGLVGLALAVPNIRLDGGWSQPFCGGLMSLIFVAMGAALLPERWLRLDAERGEIAIGWKLLLPLFATRQSVSSLDTICIVPRLNNHGPGALAVIYQICLLTPEEEKTNVLEMVAKEPARSIGKQIADFLNVQYQPGVNQYG